MTDLFISSQDCKCTPNTKLKNLVIVEGQTTIWACYHAQAEKLVRKEVWENIK